jgi:hypothetical protein
LEKDTAATFLQVRHPVTSFPKADFQRPKTADTAAFNNGCNTQDERPLEISGGHPLHPSIQ